MRTISKTGRKVTGGLMALVIAEIIETLAIGDEIVKIMAVVLDILPILTEALIGKENLCQKEKKQTPLDLGVQVPDSNLLIRRPLEGMLTKYLKNIATVEAELRKDTRGKILPSLKKGQN